ncbi:hypothetical protein TNCV_2555901 [Trichonephila clavipes]|nr:hypothetical protein TNCV_2555901 [Trichonephila clavipes]
MAIVDSIFCIRKIHRLRPGSNPQPWIQKASVKPTTPPSRLVTGSHVFSLTCPLGSLGPEIMATLFQPNPRSEA